MDLWSDVTAVFFFMWNSLMSWAELVWSVSTFLLGVLTVVWVGAGTRFTLSPSELYPLYCVVLRSTAFEFMEQ